MEQKVNLQPYQQKVVEEYKELKDKTTKLGAFILDNPIYLTLREEEQKDLNLQNEAMCQYCDILERRISRF